MFMRTKTTKDHTHSSLRRLARHLPAGFMGLFRFAILFGLVFLIVYPFLFMIVMAFRSPQDLQDPSIVWITRHWSLENVRTFLSLVDFGSMMGYTSGISLGSALLQMFVCGLAGYGFARFRFKGHRFLFGLVLFTIIVPPQTYILQLFLLFRLFPVPFIGGLLEQWTGSSTLNLVNTAAPYLLQAALGMGLRSGLFIYIYRQFFRGLPKELEQAASIDGCNAFGTYFRVMLPNAKPAMVTVFLLSFVWNWNDAFSQNFLSMSRDTVAVFLANIRSSIESTSFSYEDPTYLYLIIQTGALLCVVPLLILFLFGQRFFTESVERTGLVG